MARDSEGNIIDDGEGNPPGGQAGGSGGSRFWSDRVQRALNSMTPTQRQQAIDSWAGNAQTAEAWYDNAKAAGAIKERDRDVWADDAANDVYTNRDWSNSPNKAIFDAQYQRLIGLGIPPNRAKRIVSVAIGGMEHDFQQYGNTPWAGGASDDPNMDPTEWVDRFVAGDEQYDPGCPQEAPYRDPKSPSGECVEKPWDDASDNPDAANWGSAGSGGGGGGGGGGKNKDKNKNETQWGYAGKDQLKETGDVLQDTLIKVFNKQGANLAGGQDVFGASLKGGGLMWGEGLKTPLEEGMPGGRGGRGGRGGGGGGNGFAADQPPAPVGGGSVTATSANPVSGYTGTVPLPSTPFTPPTQSNPVAAFQNTMPASSNLTQSLLPDVKNDQPNQPAPPNQPILPVTGSTPVTGNPQTTPSALTATLTSQMPKAKPKLQWWA